MKKRIFTRTLILLSLVSLFTDMASEMLYPVMPLYLDKIGFSALGIGILEGIAQAAAGLSKGYFGKWSDQLQRRTPFVQLGYSLSALAKPLMAVWAAPLWVLAARTMDRLGKGIRTGARDALLSAAVSAENRASAFGFHRAMDTLGAALGPAIALLFLWQYPGSYRALFLLTFFPGLLAVGATLLLREPKQAASSKKEWPDLSAFFGYVRQASSSYRRLLVGLLAFALINSSDLFLLLLMKYQGMGDRMLIGLYIFYNFIYALAAYPAGRLADRWGVKQVFIIGLFFFALAYTGLAFAISPFQFAIILIPYAFYAASTEGVAKAWISNLAKEENTGAAIGTYEGFRSIATLLASSLAGLVWVSFGPVVLFAGTAAAAILIMAYFRIAAPNI